jgi:Tfp pilus assembly protein PilF
MVQGRYTLSVTRLLFSALFFIVAGTISGQTQAPPQTVVQEPPEEDVNPQAVKEYTFNPLQATKEIKVGNYYLKKGSHRAAARRFEEALKWDPNSAEAYLRLGDARTKLGDTTAARAAYEKFLELDPESKEASSVRKKMEQDSAKRQSGSTSPTSRRGSN